MNYLSEIARLSQSNMGGIAQLQVARKADVISIPEPVDGVIYGNLEFQQGKGFVRWMVADQTIEMSSETNDGRESTFKSNQLPFTIAKDRPEIKKMLDAATEDEFIVLYKDSNGKFKLFGTLEGPVRFAYNHSSGQSRSARNGYACQFFFEGSDNLNFYEGNIASAPGGAAPVIIQWNGVFQLSAQPGDVVNIVSEFKIQDFLININ